MPSSKDFVANPGYLIPILIAVYASTSYLFANPGAFIAVAIAILLSPIPRNLGLYRWHAYHRKNDQYIGRVPATHHGIPWKFTFEQLKGYNLAGQSALVTGSNCGIGFQIALHLARQGANVHMVCRNVSKCEAAAKKIRSDPEYAGGTISTWTMDTSSLTSVKEFAQTFLLSHGKEPLDMLFLNAGMGFPPDNEDGKLPLSDDGIEVNFATNYLGHHLLYKHLVPVIQKSTKARISLTTSGASFNSYDYGVATDLDTLNGVNFNTETKNKNYSQSKLCQVLWAKKLTRELGSNSSCFVNAGHPGIVNTEIFEKSLKGKPSTFQRIKVSIMKSIKESVFWTSAEGALTLLYLGVAVDQLAKNDFRGRYFHPQSQEVKPCHWALDEKLQDDLWNFSNDLVKEFL